MVTELTNRESLIAMGYREMHAGKWAKPIGYQLFTFDEKSGKFHNWFKDIQGKICVWESYTYVDGDLLKQLKDWETWTKHDLFCNGHSNFELSVIDI